MSLVRVKGTVFRRCFGVDRKTMQRWGQALQSGDAEQLVRAFAGRGGHRKRTPEIQSFIRLRFPEIYQQSRTGDSQRVREEIRRVLGVRLSGECWRPLLKSLRAELRHEVNEPARRSEAENRETACECDGATSTPSPVETPPGPLAVAPAAEPPPDIRKESPVLPESAPAAAVGLCHHLGVLLFSAVLVGVEKQVAQSGWLLKQWLAALLLGAVNIEQTKLLDFEDLRRLLGRTLRSLFPQRNQLTELAGGTTATRLLSFNAQRVGAAQQRDFYFDPHTKHYTGMQNVRKGWCARIRWADEVLHSDFFHTATGQPVYLEGADNDQDMRERLAALLPRFRQALGLPAEAVVIFYLMFNRWTQENDFKYLDEPFGINQITSYASVAYERLQDQVQQKQIKSGAYKAAQQKVAQLKSQLSKLFLSQHQHPRKSARRTERITALTRELEQAQQDQAKTQQEVSRLEVLIGQQMVRLDTRNKRLLDSLKLIARNAFYQALEPFKTAYHNYRDDHELFRNLTQAAGVLAESADQVDAYIRPTVIYPPAIEKIVAELLSQINGQDPRMPDGSGRRLQLHLGQKTDLHIAIVS